MGQEKGSRLVADVVQHFRDAAAESPVPGVGAKLKELAAELDRMAEKHYWKTRKGVKDMEGLLEEVEDLRAALAACEEDDASQRYCTNFFSRLEHLIEHVKSVEAHG